MPEVKRLDEPMPGGSQTTGSPTQLEIGQPYALYPYLCQDPRDWILRAEEEDREAQRLADAYRKKHSGSHSAGRHRR